MARCEECLHFEICEALEQGNGLMKVPPIHCGFYKPTADVAPKSEVAKKALLDLKRQVHDKAVYPHGKDMYSFVNLKVFDALLQDCLNKYTEEKL